MISSIRLEKIVKNHTPEGFTLCIDNLEFSNNHIHVVAGSNGSGKSTLLRVISLLDSPDKGRIMFDNECVFPGQNGQKRLRKKIGFVMQNPYLFNMNVFENVAIGLKIRRYKRAETVSMVRKILVDFKIDHLSNQNANKLSSGELQKVAIAQILVWEPKVILLDEPTANIDAQSTLSIEKIIKQIHKTLDSLIIITTHSLDQAYRISSNTISLREGKVIN